MNGRDLRENGKSVTLWRSSMQFRRLFAFPSFNKARRLTMLRHGALGAAPINQDKDGEKGRVQQATVRRYRRGELPAWLQTNQDDKVGQH